MPSRRSVLSLVTVAFAGCAGGPILSVPRIAGQSCPPLDLPERHALCSHTDAAGGLDVSASPSTVSTSAESLEQVVLRIENGTGGRIRFDTSKWRLYRNRGLGWNERGDSYGTPRNVETLSPGGSFSWNGIDALFDLGASGRTPAGLYAAALPVQTEVDDGSDGTVEVTEGPVACVFLFRVSTD